MAKKIRLKRFPIGIFLLLFFIEALIAGGACAAYFLFTARSRIEEITASTRQYAVMQAEAFEAAARQSYQTKKNANLVSLFQEKVIEQSIDEAFFVLKNGSLAAHSHIKTAMKKKKKEADRGGFSHSLDLILKPVEQKSAEVMFIDYNIAAKPVPFETEVRTALERYVYPRVAASGWLASRAVFVKKKPVGAVGFIISKGKIFSFLRGHMETSVRVLVFFLGVSFCVSLFVSLVVLVRYRSLQKKAAGGLAGSEARPAQAGRYSDSAVNDLYDLTMPAEPAGDYSSSGAAPQDPDTPVGLDRKIKDAIPVVDKERR